MLTKQPIFSIFIICFSLVSNLVYGGYYNIQELDKEVIISDPCTTYYAVDIGDADPAVDGREIYIISLKNSNSESALTQHIKLSATWTQVATIDTNNTAQFLDIEVGNVSNNTSVIGGDELYYVTEDNYRTAYMVSGPQWVTENLDELTSGVDIYPTLELGCVTIGTANPAAIGNEVYFGTKGEDGNGRILGLWMNTPGTWSTKLYDASTPAIKAYDIVIGERFALLQPAHGNSITWTGFYTAQTVSFLPDPPQEAIWEDKWEAPYNQYHYRSIAIGDIRPESTPGDGNDPWYGNELIRGASKDTGWPPDPLADPTTWSIWVNNWRNWTDNGTGPLSSYWTEEVIVEKETGVGVSRFIRRIATGDLDNDGLDEFVIAAYGTSPVLSIFSWDDKLNCYQEQLIDDSKEYYDVRIRDVDGDGKLDIVYASDGEVGIYYNTGYIPGHIQGDVDEDGKVDFVDLSILANYWLLGT